jgi:hypothetical protein
MKSFQRSLPAMAFALSLAMGGTFSVLAEPQHYPAGEPYPAPYTDLRSIVDKTQSDLRGAADLEHNNGKQQDRYHNAQEHLSTFDRHLVKGKFDRGELEKAIGEIKGILDHNVLQASSRDALLRDMEDLRAAKDRHY